MSTSKGTNKGKGHDKVTGRQKAQEDQRKARRSVARMGRRQTDKALAALFSAWVW